MKNVFLCILILSAMGIQAQNLQNANWYFGNQRAFSFSPPNQNSPQLIAGSAMSTQESCASVSDTNGNLLFYTNGIKIWNNANVEMPNGSGLNGSLSSTQGAVIVPKPGSPSRYYIFTINGITGSLPTEPNRGLYYTEVDVILGDVVAGVKNIAVSGSQGASTESEKLTATKHADGVNYWVVAQLGSIIRSYRVTSTGVQAFPLVTSTAPVNTNTGIGISPAVGQMKISPNGQKIGICYNTGTIALGDFNSSTGQASFPNSLIAAPLAYSLEFSPDSQFVYFSPGGSISYTNTTTIAVQTVNPSNIGGKLQLALNGKIYVSSGSSLYVISNPNTPGSLGLSTTPIQLGALGNNLPQWVPMHGQDPCTSLTLTSEPNTTHAYAYRSSITAETNYIVDPAKDITMKARDFIVLKPDTHIKSNSLYLARIESCDVGGGLVQLTKQAFVEQSTDEIVSNKTNKTFSLSPNPATTVFTVQSTVNVKHITVTSFDGKVMFSRGIKDKTTSYTIDAGSYTQGIYSVTVLTETGETQTQKLIKN